MPTTDELREKLKNPRVNRKNQNKPGKPKTDQSTEKEIRTTEETDGIPKIALDTGPKLTPKKKPVKVPPSAPRLPPDSGREPTTKDAFKITEKTKGHALLEAIALWNTIWALIVYNLRQYFPATDSMWGNILAVLISGIGNILGVFVAQWKANAEILAGLKENEDTLVQQNEIINEQALRIQVLEAQHLHDLALGVAYESEVALARGEAEPKYLSTRMKEALAGLKPK